MRGDEEYSCGDSDDNEGRENPNHLLRRNKSIKFSKLNFKKKNEQIYQLWHVCYSNALGGAMIVKIFIQLQKEIILYGSTMNLNNIKSIKLPKKKSQFIILPDSRLKR